jgi:uncharacterized protein (UPF0335 family)
MPEDLRTFIQRVERDQKEIDRLEAAVAVFLQEVEDKIAALNEIRSNANG